MSDRTSLDLLKDSSPTVSVGVLAADLMNLGAEITRLETTSVKLLHVDVMDGCFTPMMTVGPAFIRSLKTSLLKDVHLMIQDPLEKVEDYVAAGADVITVHAESCQHIHRVFQRLGSLENANESSRGLVRGVALNPGTSLGQIEPLLGEVEMVMLLGINPGWSGQSLVSTTTARIRELKRMISQSGRDILVCVDGGVTSENLGELAAERVDVIVTGSAVFSGGSPVETVQSMFDTLQAVTRH